MKKLDKREKNLLIVLIVALTIGALDFILNMDSYLSFYSDENVLIEQTINKQAQKEEKIAKRNVPAESLKNWGEDPFYDPALRVRKKIYKPKIEKISLKLKAISMAESMSVAMINNKVLAIGDLIDGYIVKNIQEKEVTLVKGEQTTILKLQ